MMRFDRDTDPPCAVAFIRRALSSVHNGEEDEMSFRKHLAALVLSDDLFSA